MLIFKQAFVRVVAEGSWSLTQIIVLCTTDKASILSLFLFKIHNLVCFPNIYLKAHLEVQPSVRPNMKYKTEICL